MTTRRNTLLAGTALVRMCRSWWPVHDWPRHGSKGWGFRDSRGEWARMLWLPAIPATRPVSAYYDLTLL